MMKPRTASPSTTKRSFLDEERMRFRSVLAALDNVKLEHGQS